MTEFPTASAATVNGDGSVTLNFRGFDGIEIKIPAGYSRYSGEMPGKTLADIAALLGVTFVNRAAG